MTQAAQIVKQQPATGAITRSGQGWLVAPRDTRELMAYAEAISNSAFVPKEFRGKAGDVIAAIQMGAELGLAPIQSLQNICVINGRPSIWGDAMIALVLAHPECDDVRETFDDATKTAKCVVTRVRAGKNPRVVEQTYSLEDAKLAKLDQKDTYKQHLKRMLKMRARGFALRDAFPDVLKGLITREEAVDMQPTVQDAPAPSWAQPAQNVTPPAAAAITAPSSTTPAPSGPCFHPRWQAGQWGGQPLTSAPSSVLNLYVNDLQEKIDSGVLNAEQLRLTQAALDEANEMLLEKRHDEIRAERTSESATDDINAGLEAAVGTVPQDGNESWGLTPP